MLTLVGIGGALVLILNLANSLVQTHVDDDIRGRVMGIYSLTFFGLLPIGSLMMGQIAEFSSEPVALAIGSILLFGVAILIKAYVPQIWKLE
jgi:MFS family permease